MSTRIQHSPQELIKITDRIRIQVAAGTAVDATVDATVDVFGLGAYQRY